MSDTRKRRKQAVVEYRGFSIRRRGDSWMVDARRDGLNKRKSFAPMPDGETDRAKLIEAALARAKTYCDQLAAEVESKGTQAVALPDKLRLDATEAAAMLNGRATLLEAAAYWTRQHPEAGAVTLSEMCDRFIAHRRGLNCRETTLQERRHKVQRLCRDMGAQSVFDVTSDKLSTWLDVQGFGPVTKDNFRRCFAAVWRFGRKQGLIDTMPAVLLDKIHVDEHEPEFLPVPMVAKLLKAAEQGRPDIAGALAIAFFAGLRPGELQGLQWESVKCRARKSERFIRVKAITSKRRTKTRLVPVNETLARWLRVYGREGGPVCPKPMTFRRARLKVMKKAGLKTWIPDITRHTCATYRFAETQDKARVAAELGHSVAILEKHYRGLATPAEAKGYWKLAPKPSPKKATRPKLIKLCA